MFTSISWQQYLLTVSSLATIYYGAVLFLYYSVEIVLFFTRKKDTSAYTQTSHFSRTTILGEAKPDPNVSSISNEELLFNSEAKN